MCVCVCVCVCVCEVVGNISGRRYILITDFRKNDFQITFDVTQTLYIWIMDKSFIIAL